MANRHTLHISKVPEFKEWLVKDGWKLEEPKGLYEEIRARKGSRVFIAYRKLDMKAHLSTSDRDNGVVMAFIKSQKETKTETGSLTEEQIEALKKENYVLKNRCWILSQGVMCIFCPLECKHRNTPFRNDKEEKE